MEIKELRAKSVKYIVGDWFEPSQKIGKILENKERFDIFNEQNVMLASIKVNEFMVIYNDSINNLPTKAEKVEKEFNLEVLQLTEYFIDNLKLNNPKVTIPTNLYKWNLEMDLMLRKDGLTASEISRLIDFCQTDNFWKSVILSVPKLRQKKDQLLVKMKSVYRPLDRLKDIANGGSSYDTTGSSKGHIFDFNEL